jgi:hypothetical protein
MQNQSHEAPDWDEEVCNKAGADDDVLAKYDEPENVEVDPEGEFPLLIPATSGKDGYSDYDRQVDLIRDRVKQVTRRVTTGFILSGSGGIGKSHTVIQTLQEEECEHQLLNTNVTPKGLFRALQSAPDQIFLLEDTEQLLGNKIAAGILRSALWSQAPRGIDGRQPRVITWCTDKGEEKFEFTGGLIILLNGSLPDTPEMQATKTRVPCHEFVVSDEQVAAKILELAQRGFDEGSLRLPPELCREVAEFVIAEAADQEKRLNLRLYKQACCDRYSFEVGWATTPWRELVRQQVQSETKKVIVPLTCNAKVQMQLSTLQEILERTDDVEEQVRLFCEATSLSRSTFFRRKKELINRSIP